MCVPDIVHFFFPVSDHRQETVIVQAELPLTLAVRVFFNIFPPIAAATSFALFMLTGHPVPLISTLVFGIWTLASWCPDCFEAISAPRQRARNIQTTYTTVLHQPPQYNLGLLYNQPPISRNTGLYAPHNSINLAPPQPHTTFTVFPPAANPHERAPVGRQAQVTSPMFLAPAANPHERAPVGRSAQSSVPTFLAPAADPNERASVGRRRQEPEDVFPRATSGSGDATRARVGRG